LGECRFASLAKSRTQRTKNPCSADSISTSTTFACSHHLAQAGFTERAIEYLRKAGRRAIERSANAEAIRHLTSALESMQSLPEGPERKHAALELEAMGDTRVPQKASVMSSTRRTETPAR
jgi:predicted ATPase